MMSAAIRRMVRLTLWRNNCQSHHLFSMTAPVCFFFSKKDGWSLEKGTSRLQDMKAVWKSMIVGQKKVYRCLRTDTVRPSQW